MYYVQDENKQCRNDTRQLPELPGLERSLERASYFCKDHPVIKIGR